MVELTCSLCQNQFLREKGQVTFAKKEKKTDVVFCKPCWEYYRGECMSIVNRVTKPNANHGKYVKQDVKLNNNLAGVPQYGKMFLYDGHRYVCTGIVESLEQGKNLVITRGDVFFEETIKWVGDEDELQSKNTGGSP